MEVHGLMLNCLHTLLSPLHMSTINFPLTQTCTSSHRLHDETISMNRVTRLVNISSNCLEAWNDNIRSVTTVA
jgi:hypothetical protein